MKGIKVSKSLSSIAKLVEPLAYEFRHAVRRAMLRPWYSASIALTLALALGSTIAVFTLLDAVDLRPLPYADTDRLVAVQLYRPSNGPCPGCRMTSPPVLTQRLVNARSFEIVSVYRSFGVALQDRVAAEYIRATEVGPEHFMLLGESPLMGRVIQRSDAHPDADRTLVASYEFWKKELSGDVAVVGKRIALISDQDGMARSYRIIGVMPRGFDYPVTTGAWVAPPSQTRRSWILAKLKPGVKREAAETEVRALVRIASNEDGALGASPVRVLSLREDLHAWSGVNNKRFVLAGMIVIALALACTNVVTLFLIRLLSTEVELATRMALGSSMLRLTSQLLLDVLVLAVTGGALGIAVAYVTLQMLTTRLGYAGLSVTLGARAGVFGVVLTVVVALLIAAVAASSIYRGSVMDRLRLPTSAGFSRPGRAQGIAIMMQTAGAVFFASLAFQGLQQLARVQGTDLGVDPNGLLRIEFRAHRQSDPAVLGDPAALRQVVDNDVRTLSAIRGVHIAAVEARTRQDPAQFIDVERRNDGLPWRDIVEASVTEGYFRAIGASIVSGRGFDQTDREGAPDVGILSRSTATQLWPGEIPTGKRILLRGEEDPPDEITIVGVVSDVRFSRWEAGTPGLLLYRPFQQAPSSTRQYWIRSGEALNTVLPGVFAAVEDLRPNLSRTQYPAVHVLANELAHELRGPRLTAAVSTSVAICTLLLAAVGAFGLVAFTVRATTRDIAIRLALGAPRALMYRVVCTKTAAFGVVGVVVGGLSTAMLYRVAGVLVVVTPPDTAFMLVGAILVTAVVAAAAFWPVRRALQRGPSEALRLP